MKHILIFVSLFLCSLTSFAQPGSEVGELSFVENNTHCEATLYIYCYELVSSNCPTAIPDPSNGLFGCPNTGTTPLTYTLAPNTSTNVWSMAGQCGNDYGMMYKVCWNSPNCQTCTGLMATPKTIWNYYSSCTGGVQPVSSSSVDLGDCCHCYSPTVTIYDDPANPNIGYMTINARYDPNPCE